MKLTPPHGPLRYPKNSNYTVLRELIEETHNWRQKKNRGTLQLFSHTSFYFVDLDAQENTCPARAPPPSARWATSLRSTWR